MTDPPPAADPTPDLASQRLALAPDLHLTWQGHLLTVATSRWEPGIFMYDIEYLSIEIKPQRSGVRVKLGGRGEHFDFQVLRFELDDGAYARLNAFVELVCAHRDRLRAGAQ